MELDQYKNRLEEEKATLINNLASFAIQDKDTPGDWEAVREDDPSVSTSSDSVADELEEMNERQAAEEPLKKQLAKVNLALEKIANGKFGICEINGEEIEEDRLNANPSARTCKEHMEEEENLPL